MFETNSIIRASAGTGKTFALATRFIRLMLLDKVEPETIVALTFSRAAAQEIYTKILDRLCKASVDGVDKNGKSFAENEWEMLLEDFRPDENGRERIKDGEEKLKVILDAPPPHGPRDFARLLRKLVDTQHLGAIATLDSFILKIVRNFPKEMGIENAVSVLDPAEENAAVKDAVKSALSRRDGADCEIGKAFVAAQKGDLTRKCLGAIDTILAGQGWRNFVLSHPECLDQENGGANRWTVESMAARLGVDLNSKCPDLSMIKYNDVKRKNTISPEEKFVNLAKNYDGTNSPLETTDAVKALMDFFWKNPTAEVYEYTFYSKPFKLQCDADGAAAIHGAIRHMVNVFLKRQLEIVEAKIRLVEAVEKEYERMTRRAGKLTFADFTAYSAEEKFSDRGIALKNVEFRFDSKFDHWALDEFQDTSELQWRCLKELVSGAAEAGYNGEGRSAMAVGDMKQSIYTWRGASSRPFEDIADWYAMKDFERDFSASHRYGPNIAKFVNDVFGKNNIQVGELIPSACTAAVESWREGWRDHVSHEAADYVKVVEAEKDEDDEEDNEILPQLAKEIKSLWQRHDEEGSTDTVGILVRGNSDGLKVAEYLRKKGLEVVWEGLNPCSDDPVVQSVLSLLKIADHPSDTTAWKTASELIDIRSRLLPECDSLESASAAVSLSLTQQGLSRTLKDWCGVLRESGVIQKNGLTSDKLRQLVELAVSFEGRSSGNGGILAFIDYVAESGRREIASSHEVIRILTIHRSKGLGIDHVFVPLFEIGRDKSAIDRPKDSSPLFADEDWVLSHLAKGVEQLNAKTKAAYEKMCSDRFAESLRTYYVALTRAKKSMVVIFPKDEEGKTETSQGLLMRDLVKSAVGDLPYEAGVLPSLKPKDAGSETPARQAWPATGARQRIERVTPSHGAGHVATERRAADLFDADYGDAAQKGTEAHTAYAEIEWVEEDDGRPLARKILSTDFHTAFVKPSPDATVWRERSYELFDGKRWETGQFDRVVFSGTGADRKAVIYDFKTNAKREKESAAEFAGRMVKTYSSQMNSYRNALHVLTKIPLERIEVSLLLDATGARISC